MYNLYSLLFTVFIFLYFLLVFKGPVCLSFKPCLLNPCGDHEECLEVGELGKYECMCPKFHSKYPNCTKVKSDRESIENDLNKFSKKSTLLSTQQSSKKRIVKSTKQNTWQSTIFMSTKPNLGQDSRSLAILVLMSFFIIITLIGFIFAFYVKLKLLLCLIESKRDPLIKQKTYFK